MWLNRVFGAVWRNILWTTRKFLSIPKYFISVIARKMSENFSPNNTPAECVYPPVKLSLQSVGVKESKKRCIATCFHPSVYEIATHFLINFFVSYYFDGNESCLPEKTHWTQWFQGLFLTTAEPQDPAACPCWHQSDDCFLSSELRAPFKGEGWCGVIWIVPGWALNIHHWMWEEKLDHLEIWQKSPSLKYP